MTAPLAATPPATTATISSPFRWVGGKRWLIPQIQGLLANMEIARYHEPFLGGGSVFLSVPNFSRAYLSDSNKELISTYRAIRDHPNHVARRAAEFSNNESTYYKVRSSTPADPVDRAARFLFLNHTSFNGIYRVNREGVYNVPFGRRKRINLPTSNDLRDVATRLKRAKLRAVDFERCLDYIGPGDLVFLDPPYTVAHDRNGFVKYNQRLFSFDDQIRLSSVIDEVRRRSAFYILSNAAHESIAELFEKGDTRLVTVRRNVVGGAKAGRGQAREYLFTNLGTHQ